MNLDLLPAFFRRVPDLGPPEPDFLCVGMVKAATDWLFDQLVNHPDFWIPPVKELRYLNLELPLLDNTLRKLSHYRAKRVAPERDRNFLFMHEAAALAGKPRDLEAYAALFRFKGRRLSGDISPGYYDLGGEVIAAIAHRFPRLNIILMVREPLDRVWSHLSMRQREGHFDAALLENVDAFDCWFTQSEVRRACFATEVAARWHSFAPQIAFRHFFFDDVEQDPAQARAQIIRYLGGNPRKKSGKLPPGHNRKANLPKLPLSKPIKNYLLDQLGDEIRGCADLFGGPAENWPSRYSL